MLKWNELYKLPSRALKIKHGLPGGILEAGLIQADSYVGPSGTFKMYQ